MSFSTITIDDTTSEDSINDWAAKKKHYMRTAVCLFLPEKDVTDKLNNYYLKISVPQLVGANLADNVTWTAAVLAMVSKPTTGDKIKVALKEWPAETYLDIDKDKLCNLNRWKVGVDGKILFSDNSGKTLSFDNNGVVSSTDNMTFTNKSCDEMIQKLGNIGSLL